MSSYACRFTVALATAIALSSPAGAQREIVTTEQPGGRVVELLHHGDARVTSEAAKVGGGSSIMLRFPVPSVAVREAELRLELLAGYGEITRVGVFGVSDELDGLPDADLAAIAARLARGDRPTGVIALGERRLNGETGRWRFRDESLSDWADADANGMLTLIMSAGGGPGRDVAFAADSSLAFAAPTLEFRTAPRFAAVPVQDPERRIDGTGAVETRGAWWSLNAKAWTTGWREVGRERSVFLPGDRDPLRRMLGAEVDRRSGRITTPEWTARVVSALSERPDASGELAAAFIALADASVTRVPEPEFTRFDPVPLIEDDGLPDAALSAFTELAVIGRNPPGSDPDARMAHFRRYIPSAFGRPARPWMLASYIEALRDAEGDQIAGLFAAQAAELLEDPGLRATARLYRLAAADEHERSDVRRSIVEGTDDPSIRALLLPGHIAAETLSGRVEMALTLAGIRDVSAESVAMLRALMGTADSPVGSDARFVALLGDAALPTLGFVDVGLAWAEALWDNERYQDASLVLFEVLGQTHAVPWSAQTAAPFDSLSSIRAGGEQPNAIAAYLFAYASARVGDARLAPLWRARAHDAGGPSIQRFIRVERAREAILEGRFADASEVLETDGTSSQRIDRLRSLAKAEASAQPSSELAGAVRVRALLEAARDTVSVADASKVYDEAASLALEIGHVETAVAVLELFAGRFPDSPMAFVALSRTARILELSGRERSAERAMSLREYLIDTLGIEEAEQLAAEAAAAISPEAVRARAGAGQ